MQGRYICFHFTSCHYSAVLILSEGLEGRGEWVATAACEHSRCSSLPRPDEESTLAVGLLQRRRWGGTELPHSLLGLCMGNMESLGQ